MSLGAFLGVWGWIVGCSEAQAESRITPSVAISERYDDNPRFSSRRKEGDFATVVAPSFAFRWPGREVDVTGNIGSSWTQYQKNSDLSRLSSLGGITLKADTLTGRLLRDLGLTVSDNYNYTQEFPEFAQFGNVNEPASGGIQAGRFTTFANTFVASPSYALSARTRLTAGYSNAFTRFSGGSTLIDSATNVVTGGWTYAISPLTSLVSGYTYSKFSFGGGASVQTHGLDVGVRRQFLADLNLDVNVGGTYLPSIERLTYNFNGGLTKKFAAATMGLRFARSVSSSGGVAALVSTREILSAFLTYQVTSSFSVTFTGNHSTTKSIGVRTVDITSYNLSPGLNFAVNRWTNLTASYTHFNQQTQGLVGAAVNRNLLTIGLTVTWP